MKKTSLLLIVCFLVVTSTSCIHKEYNNYISDLKFNLQKDTLKIEYDLEEGFISHFTRNDSVFLVTYDNFTNLNFFYYDNNYDLFIPQKSHVVSESIFSSNDEFGKITKIASINDTQFWFYKSIQKMFPYELFLYDINTNKIIFSIKFEEKDLVKEELKQWIFDQLITNPISNKLLVYIYSMKEECSSLYYKGDYNCYIAEVDYESKEKLNFLQIKLPNIYDSIKNGDYSYDSFIYLATGHDNKIIVSFAISQQILILNPKTLEYHFVEPNHKNFRAPIKNDLSNQLYLYDIFVRNAYRSFVYNNLIYNPFRKEYYRFYQTEMPDKKDDGTFTTAEDMKIGVFVLSKNFEPIGDYIFSNEDKFYVGHNNIIPTDKGFVSYITNKKNEIIFIKFERE